jgi:uncharacterized YccA/Bax inhibitor family protein
MRNPAFRGPEFGQQPVTYQEQPYQGQQPYQYQQQPYQAPQPVSAAQLQEMYSRPSLPPQLGYEPMTVQDTLVKSALSFAILLGGAVLSWFLIMTVPSTIQLLLWPAAIVGIVLGFVNTFKREPSPTLILLYAAVEGVFVGAISLLFETLWPGIVMQAVVATLVVVGVTLALFASGKIRASKKATKVFLIIVIGYAVFSLVNVAMMFLGVSNTLFGMRTSVVIFGIPLGVILGILAVLLGAYSLVLDFDFIQRGVQNRAPAKYGWTGAFGIMVTVIWLYLEILRLLAILARR